MHVILLVKAQRVLGEMQRRFGITLLAPGVGKKIVQKNNSLVSTYDVK